MFSNKTVLTLSAVLISTAYAGGATAQTKEGQIEEITVEGRYLSLDKLNAVKTPTPVIDIPQSLSIFSADQISEQAFKSFGDILKYTPGLAVSQGEGHRDAIIIRGNQTTADFYIDGVRDDVQYYRPLYNVEQVEILRGSNALLFGRGGAGGVINRVIKKPELDEQFSSVNAGVNTFGAYSFAGDTNFAAGENVAVRLNGYYQSHENHRDVFDGESLGFNPTVKVAFSPDTIGVFSYEYVDDDRVVDRGVPAVSIDGAPNVPLGGFDDIFFGSPEANFTTLQAHILKSRVDHTFSENLRGNFTAQFADYDKLYQNLFPSGNFGVNNDGVLGVELDGYRDTTDRQNLIFQANLIGEYFTGSVGHTVLFGAEYAVQDTTNARLENEFDTNGDDQDFVPFVNGALVIPGFQFINNVPGEGRDRDSDVTVTSFYIQDQIDLTEKFKLILGLRFDEFDIDVFDRIEENDLDDVGGEFSRVDREISTRLGFIYKPVENASIYASFSESFLPQSGDQFLTLTINTANTAPQIVRNTEIGAKWDIKPGLSLTTAIFELDRGNFTTVDPTEADENLFIQGSITRGVELELTGNLTERWSITGGYAYLDSEVQVDEPADIAPEDSIDGNETRQTPENTLSLWSSYQVNDKLRVALGATYQDSVFVLEDNTVEVPSFTRVDAGVFYDLSQATSLQLNVENLFNVDYFPDSHSNNNISTGAPLNARLSVTTRF